MKKSIINIALLLLLIISSSISARPGQDISVKVDKKTGAYTIHSDMTNWNFAGSIGTALYNVSTRAGKDESGSFNEISFGWNKVNQYKGTIKWYQSQPVILFSVTCIKGQGSVPEAFPKITAFPKDLKTFSFEDDNFAPPQFKLNETSTPWLFFDGNKNAFIISPASDFMVSKLISSGGKVISSGLNEEIKTVPENFTHSTILVISKGIGSAWDTWGKALRNMYHRSIPKNDDGAILKYFGYWTDNGADYYYNYDTTLGYAKTLLKLKKEYDEEGIPLGYMQLDSWWYDKSIYDVAGKPDADHKNNKLPYGPWNRYGGIMQYSADSFLFPDGLAAFKNELSLPLITHSRWIDPKSPYNDKYKISGYAAIDKNYWSHIAGYLKKSGVFCYEQDWLNHIYFKSPEMSEDINVGNYFTGYMAGAFAKAGISMQYCMAMPRHFLQGLKYNNLTTIRTSDDRFEPGKWRAFLYDSRFAYECGMYPWCDVFKSGELGNMILAVLSAGPVGTGDAIGKENKTNILKSCRKDGTLIKPDVPILPVDEDYVNDSENNKVPMIGYTYTKHSNIKSGYVFAFINDSSYSRDVKFIPVDFGISGKVLVYDALTGQSKVLQGGDRYSGSINESNFAYYIIAPFVAKGISFIGDTSKIVPAGKQRIAEIKIDKNKIELRVLFSKEEDSVSLLGYSEMPVKCSMGKISYDKSTHYFNLTLPSGSKKEVYVTINEL